MEKIATAEAQLAQHIDAKEAQQNNQQYLTGLAVAMGTGKQVEAEAFWGSAVYYGRIYRRRPGPAYNIPYTASNIGPAPEYKALDPKLLKMGGLSNVAAPQTLDNWDSRLSAYRSIIKSVKVQE